LGSRIFAETEFGNTVSGVFTPVLAKESNSFSLIDCITVGVEQTHRNFDPMRKQVEAWQWSELPDVTAKVVIYEAFVEGKLEAPGKQSLCLEAPSLMLPVCIVSPRTSRRGSRERGRFSQSL
jgi:hypothetical protein